MSRSHHGDHRARCVCGEVVAVNGPAAHDLCLPKKPKHHRWWREYD